jgi:hypothetical protein
MFKVRFLKIFACVCGLYFIRGKFRWKLSGKRLEGDSMYILKVTACAYWSRLVITTICQTLTVTVTSVTLPSCINFFVGKEELLHCWWYCTVFLCVPLDSRRNAGSTEPCIADYFCFVAYAVQATWRRGIVACSVQATWRHGIVACSVQATWRHGIVACSVQATWRQGIVACSRNSAQLLDPACGSILGKPLTHENYANNEFSVTKSVAWFPTPLPEWLASRLLSGNLLARIA